MASWDLTILASGILWLPQHDLNLTIKSWLAQARTCLTSPRNMSPHGAIWAHCDFVPLVPLYFNWKFFRNFWRSEVSVCKTGQMNRKNKSKHEGFNSKLLVGNLPTLRSIQRKIRRRKKAFKQPFTMSLSRSSMNSRMTWSPCTYDSRSCPSRLWPTPLDARPPFFSRHDDVAPFPSVRGWPNAFHGPSGLGSWGDAQNHTRTKSERSSGKVANLQLLGCLPTLHDFPPPTLACHQILGTRGLETYSPHWASWTKRREPSPIQSRSLAYMVPALRPRLTCQGSATETMGPPWV